MDAFDPDFYEDDPTPEEKQRIEELCASRPPDAITGSVVRIETDDVSRVAAFIGAWYDLAPEMTLSGVVRFPIRSVLIRVEPVQKPRRQWVPLGTRDFQAASDRCAAAGFTVTPSPTHPATAGHVDIGTATFILQELSSPVRDDSYFAGLSGAIERGDYEVSGPLELGEEREE